MAEARAKRSLSQLLVFVMDVDSWASPASWPAYQTGPTSTILSTLVSDATSSREPASMRPPVAAQMPCCGRRISTERPALKTKQDRGP